MTFALILIAFLSVVAGIALIFGAVYVANRIDEQFERRRKK